MSSQANPEEGKRWDDFAIAHGGNFLQSWGWGTFQESLGREVYRFRMDRPAGSGTEVTAQSTVIMHSLPFSKKYAYIPRGPLVRLTGDAGDDSRIDLEACIRMIRDRFTASGEVFTRIEWPYPQGTSPVSAEDLERWEFVEAKATQPAHTVIMDLAKSEEELRAAMHHKTRYNIRVAERHGVAVRDAAYDDASAFDRDFTAFLAMLEETANRDQFHTHEASYYRAMLKTLKSGSGSGLRVRLLLAEHEGSPVAGALLAEYGDTATYLHGASVAAKRQVMAPHLLHWTAIRQAKTSGFKAYDFWGVAPSDDAGHAWAGITRFKTGFGGKRVSYLGAWELPGNPFWYTLYRYTKMLRTFFSL